VFAASSEVLEASVVKVLRIVECASQRSNSDAPFVLCCVTRQRACRVAESLLFFVFGSGAKFRESLLHRIFFEAGETQCASPSFDERRMARLPPTRRSASSRPSSPL
jgi:hypothetical protein